MPDWCLNNVTLEHADSSMIERAHKAFVSPKVLTTEICPIKGKAPIYVGLFHEFVPLRPSAFAQITTMSSYLWGVQHDVFVLPPERSYGLFAEVLDVTDDSLMIEFVTRWTYPDAAYVALNELGFRINASYAVEGLDEFGSISSDLCEGSLTHVRPKSAEAVERWQMEHPELSEMWDWECDELQEEESNDLVEIS